MLKNKEESKLTFVLEDPLNDESSSLYCSIDEQNFKRILFYWWTKFSKEFFIGIEYGIILHKIKIL